MTELETVEEGQIEGQDIQPEVQPEAVEDGMYVRIPRTNYANVAPDGDWNKVVHMAKQYQELKQNGLLALGEQLADSNLSPYEVLHDWNMPAEESQTQLQVQQAQQGQQAPQGQQQEGQYVTQEQLDKLLEQRMTSLIDRRDQTRDQKAQTQRAMDAQRAAMDASLDSLGYRASPTKFALAGTDHELSPTRDLLIEPAILATAQRIHAQNLNPNAPDYQEQLWGPMSAQTIEEATNHVKQVLALIGQARLETEADNQADLPQASLGDGPAGGSVKKNPADMSEAEIKAAVNKHVAVQRAKRDK